MPGNPAVSICLTTYNRATELPKTLDSLLAQTFSDFELIISDDCSTDGTEDLCRRYAAGDSRIRYYRNAANLKMPGNLNAAISRATGEYVANVHDGDVYRPDLIEKWKKALDAVPSAAFVFNDYEAIDRNGRRRLWRMPLSGRVDTREIALHYFRTFTSCVWGTVMARRSAYQRTGPFNPRYGFISDVEMWLRLGRENDAAYINEPLILITPREANHPYAFVHWRHEFWTLGIYLDALELYKDKLPRETESFRKAYHRRRRVKLLRSMALCMKHGRWDRVAEGLAIWRDSDDPLLGAAGRLFGNRSDAPAWYEPGYWQTARLHGAA